MIQIARQLAHLPSPTDWIEQRVPPNRVAPRWESALHHLTWSFIRLRTTLTSHDDCFLIFPEGTRSRSGTMGHFKPGIGMLVAGTEIPVVPCHIRGTQQAWPSDKKSATSPQPIADQNLEQWSRIRTHSILFHELVVALLLGVF